jgi:hypothetical protein
VHAIKRLPHQAAIAFNQKPNCFHAFFFLLLITKQLENSLNAAVRWGAATVILYGTCRRIRRHTRVSDFESFHFTSSFKIFTGAWCFINPTTLNTAAMGQPESLALGLNSLKKTWGF